MKKTVFLMGVAALTLASCSQEDVMYVNQKADGNAIAFTARTAKSTRALDITTNSLQSFKVFGLKGYLDDAWNGDITLTDYFGGAVEFKRQAGPAFDASGVLRDYFASDKPYYYPTDGSDLTFMAFAPTTLDASWTPDGKLVFTDFSVKEAINEQEDIVADFMPWIKPTLDDLREDLNDETKNEDEAYLKDTWHMNDLTFEHALTKVFVSGASNSDNRYKYEVVGVKLGNVAKKGSCEGWRPEDAPEEIWNNYFDWTVDDESYGDFTYIFDEPVEIGEERTALMTNEGEYGSFMMIPQQLKAEIVTQTGETDESTSYTLKMKEGVSYVGLLMRITHADNGSVVYPFSEGVEAITESVKGVEYAWAAFPVASKWIMERTVDYYVEFGNGAGYVAPGADELLEYTPILGPQITFFEDVWSWDKFASDGTVGEGSENFKSYDTMIDPIENE